MDLVHKFTPKVEKILNQNPFDLDKSLLKICKLLKTNIIHFDWVGFYFTNSKKTHLELKSFYGTPTEHKKIPFGKGVCGQVAISNKKLIVPDVKLQKNYISCNINVKSEIVVPILLDQENIGQIDVDSKIPDRFSNKDVNLLRNICNLVSSSYGNLLYQL